MYFHHDDADFHRDADQARKPRPEDTLKCVPVSSRLNRPPSGESPHDCQDEAYPLPRLERGIQNENDISRIVNGHDHRQTPVGRCCSRIRSVQSEAITFGNLTCCELRSIASGTVLPRSRPRTLT